MASEFALIEINRLLVTPAVTNEVEFW